MPDIATLQQRTGIPVGYVIPSSGTPVLVDGIAIIKGAKHPKEARLYYEFVTTPEALKAAAQQFLRIPARTDIPGVIAAAVDSGREVEDQADGSRSPRDGRASRRVDEVLGREHQESREQAVSAGALALNGITRRFGEHTAVDNISLEIAAGELLALIGASGSGKTTTLRIVAGYENPDSGQVMLDGRDITDLPPQKRGFGMVFQHYALFPHMSVEDNVAFGLEARGVAKATRLERPGLRSIRSDSEAPASVESSRYRVASSSG